MPNSGNPTWQDSPSTVTPINAAALNALETAVKAAAPVSSAWTASTAVKAGELLTNAGVLYSVNADMTTPSSFATTGLTVIGVASVDGSTGVVNLATKYVPVHGVAPSGDTTGATDTTAIKNAIAAALPAAGVVHFNIGSYYINAPLVVLPTNSGTTNIPAPVPSLIADTSAGHIGDMTDVSAVNLIAASTFPTGQFMIDYQQNGTPYAGTGAVIKGLTLDCKNLAAGLRLQGPRRFDVRDLNILNTAAPSGYTDGSTGAFNLTTVPSGGPAGAYNHIEAVSIANAGQDSFCFGGSLGAVNEDTLVNCFSLNPNRYGYYLNGSDLTVVGAHYEGGQVGVYVDSGCTARFIGLNSYTGSAKPPTQNGVVVNGGPGSGNSQYPSVRFIGCDFVNKPGTAPTETAGAVVWIKYYGAGLSQNVLFDSCFFGANPNTTDFVYIEGSITGAVRFSNCEFKGTVTNKNVNDLSAVAWFKTCTGIDTGSRIGVALPPIEFYTQNPTATVGTWGTAYGTNIFMWFNTAPALNDSTSFAFNVPDQGGTYKLNVLLDQGPDAAIITVNVDGVAVGTLDLYTASARAFVMPITGIVLTPGPHTLQLVAASKNASSTNYYMRLNSAVLTRTA